MSLLSDAPDLYPSIEPYRSGHLDVGDGHQLFWEESGNPKGCPIVFLHGGPGAGSGSLHRRFFDPDFYRIIIFDQRGAGRSTPYADINKNTTDNLVDDLESLRTHLDVGKWFVFGGSWGSTLALVYGIRHPERCLGFILRGIFLARQKELDWFLNGMGTFFSESYREFINFLPEAERDLPLEAYYRRLTDARAETHLPAAVSWARYENACSTLLPSDVGNPPKRDILPVNGHGALALSRIEAHYFKHNMFIEEDEILINLRTLEGLPCHIIQGRYDVICPMWTADALARQWPKPGATLHIIDDAGHSAMEPGIRSALVTATNAFREI